MLPGDPVDVLRRALAALKLSDPEGWPESLVAMVGAVADLDPGALDLLADAAVQMATTAHLLPREAGEDDPRPDPT